MEQPGEQAHRRRLAGAVRAEEAVDHARRARTGRGRRARGATRSSCAGRASPGRGPSGESSARILGDAMETLLTPQPAAPRPSARLAPVLPGHVPRDPASCDAPARSRGGAGVGFGNVVELRVAGRRTGQYRGVPSSGCSATATTGSSGTRAATSPGRATSRRPRRGPRPSAGPADPRPGRRPAARRAPRPGDPRDGPAPVPGQPRLPAGPGAHPRRGRLLRHRAARRLTSAARLRRGTA